MKPLFLLLAAAQLAQAATLHVATNGDDSCEGTESQPWKTLRKAAAAVQPGDTVRIKAVEYFVGPTWRVSRAGTAEKPITYKACDNGEARITCASALPAGSWKNVTNAIYSAPIGETAMCVFRDDLQQHVSRRGQTLRHQPELRQQPGLPHTFIGCPRPIQYHEGKTGNKVFDNTVQEAAE